jgi:hypothetical protein
MHTLYGAVTAPISDSYGLTGMEKGGFAVGGAKRATAVIRVGPPFQIWPEYSPAARCEASTCSDSIMHTLVFVVYWGLVEPIDPVRINAVVVCSIRWTTLAYTARLQEARVRVLCYQAASTNISCLNHSRYSSSSLFSRGTLYSILLR